MSDHFQDLIYRQTMENVKASLADQHYNLIAANYGPHKGFMAQVLTSACGYFFTVRVSESRNTLYIQVHLPFWVPQNRRKEVGAFLNREGSGHCMGRMDLSEEGLISGLVSISLTGYGENLERLCSELPGALGREEREETLTDAARQLLLECCCPSKAFFVELQDYLLSMANHYRKKLAPLLYGPQGQPEKTDEAEEEESFGAQEEDGDWPDPEEEDPDEGEVLLDCGDPEHQNIFAELARRLAERDSRDKAKDPIPPFFRRGTDAEPGREEPDPDKESPPAPEDAGPEKEDPDGALFRLLSRRHAAFLSESSESAEQEEEDTPGS